VVTSNYPARKAGVTKLMNIDEAKKKCVRPQPPAACPFLLLGGMLPLHAPACARAARRHAAAALALPRSCDLIPPSRSLNWCSCRAKT